LSVLSNSRKLSISKFSVIQSIRYGRKPAKIVELIILRLVSTSATTVTTTATAAAAAAATTTTTTTNNNNNITLFIWVFDNFDKLSHFKISST